MSKIDASRMRKTALWLAMGAGGLLVLGLSACEHERYWRGGKPAAYDDRAKYADPEKVAELLKDEARFPRAVGRGSKTIDRIKLNSEGCVSCHGMTDDADMHADEDVGISCVDCHGGNGKVMSTMSTAGRPGEPGTPITDRAYLEAMQAAHVRPKNAEAWYGRNQLNEEVPGGEQRRFGQEEKHEDELTLHGSRNPQNTYALLNQETPEFIRFINPGDLRVADMACGSCHGAKSGNHIAKVRHSMMAHGAQLWGAVLYNNGSIPVKVPIFGESYNAFGVPERLQRVVTVSKGGETVTRRPTEEELTRQGVIPYLDPLPPWNIGQMGNILRIFERGQRLPNPETGNPLIATEPGKPDKALSPRGLGTLLRVDPVFIGIQKTRLLDPLLFFMGTNDHPGDYRHSGCTSCHVIYANDREKYATFADKDGKRPFEATDWYAKFGNMGMTQTVDPTIPKNESGHPIKHVMAKGNAIPSSQCITCHMHPGTSYANQYLGYMWWDNESDADFMFPSRTRTPTSEQEWLLQRRNPEAAALKGLWGNLYPEEKSHRGELAGKDFLERSGTPRDLDPSALNNRMEHNQFADWHGHGWMFRAVFKKDRYGNMLSAEDPSTGRSTVIDPKDPQKWARAVHLKDVHLEKGMHCVDCHFVQDTHGDGKLYGEVRNAIEITCVDCHGTTDTYAWLRWPSGGPRTSGPAAPRRVEKDKGTGNDIQYFPNGKDRFVFEKDDAGNDVMFQVSALDRNVKWMVPQTLDTVNPDSAWAKKPENKVAAERSRYAKTVMRQRGKNGEIQWGDLPHTKVKVGDEEKPVASQEKLAHSENEMECYTCHTSWMTSCAGCHLPMKANKRTPMLHNESMYARNFTQYNYQVLRDDTFQLGRDSAVKAMSTGRNPYKEGGKIVPVRSSSAVIVSSQNTNREWIYSQQQTVSAEGYSGQAFNPHFPHATGGRGTTKMCTDCHVSKDGDNNAWMAQVMLQGTNFVNFLGRYVYVAEGGEGFRAVVVTERDEPQAVLGSYLHSIAYPDEYKAFVANGRRLEESHHHGADAVLEFSDSEILDLQLRGEYLYTARGRGGFYAFDVANVDNKGFSERLISSPVSPLGQELGFKTKYAVSIASPATIAVDPARNRYSSDPSKPVVNVMAPLEAHHTNMEQPVHPMYAYIYVGDRFEGLILTFAATLLDGDPTNNFMTRAKLDDGTTAFNPNGILDGLTQVVIAGHYVYATARAGLVIIDIDKPTAPKVVGTVGTDFLRNPKGVAVQFRYAFVTDEEGLKTVDITDPTKPMGVQGSLVPMTDARRVYVARTYALVAGGKQGLGIVDVEKAERPRLVQVFDAEGRINDARDVKAGMTNASLYCYIADGRNGVRVVQLMGPNTSPQFRGFVPPLKPELIATYKTDGPALAVSKGLDRDRAVDESGNQVAVFGRLGARPMKLEEMKTMYMKDGKVWTVTDKPETAPAKFTFPVPGAP